MKVVVDSNIVFSAMLNSGSNIGDIILNSQDVFIFYGCDYLREEISEYKQKIIDGELLCEKLKELKLGIETHMIEKIEIRSDWFANL